MGKPIDQFDELIDDKSKAASVGARAHESMEGHLTDRAEATGSSAQRGQRSVEEIYETIRGQILHAQMAAGSVISQVQLAEAMEVNRTPLREALRMLQREGLVTGEYNRRTRVARLTSNDLESLYALRIAQEAIAIRMSVPRLTEAELDRVDWLLEQIRQHPGLEQADIAEGFHREFHRIIVSHAGARIVASVGDLCDHCERYRRVLVQLEPTASFTIGDREHTQIAAACRAREPITASSLLARHLARTALTLASIMNPEHDPSAVREALTLVAGATPPPIPFGP